MSYETERTRGQAFGGADVARCYAFRAPYAPAAYAALLTRIGARTRALDLGCGNGKVAAALSAHFAEVDAIDPSEEMLSEARRLHPGAANIRWICATAEAASFAAAYDLVTAGTSIHWMTPEVLFPKLGAAMTPSARLAIVDGDDVHDAPWNADWIAFKKRWIVRLGGTFEPQRWSGFANAHLDWMNEIERLSFDFEFSQPVAALIECQHSRATWSRANMGALAAEFDQELSALLEPNAKNGSIDYVLRTNLTIGTPRTEPITR